jgi:hypothetical protein
VEREFSFRFKEEYHQPPGPGLPLSLSDCHVRRMSPGHRAPPPKFSCARLPALLSLLPAGSGCNGFPDSVGTDDLRFFWPAGCSPFCTTAAADLPEIRRPVVLPGLWMQINLYGCVVHALSSRPVVSVASVFMVCLLPQAGIKRRFFGTKRPLSADTLREAFVSAPPVVCRAVWHIPVCCRYINA